MTRATEKYPRDDDWGDWLHEIKKQKALDKRWDELAAPPAVEPTLYSYECVCPGCGATSEHFSAKPMERATYSVYCARCTEADRPASSDYPNTAW